MRKISGSAGTAEEKMKAFEEATGIEVNYIGGTPNIVGNLLNEGNTVALFTTVELVGAARDRRCMTH